MTGGDEGGSGNQAFFPFPSRECALKALGLLLENASDHISCFDRQGRRLFGSGTSGEARVGGGQTISGASPAVPPLPHEASVPFLEAMAEAFASGSLVTTEYSVMHKGEKREFRTLFLPVGEGDDRTEFVLAISRDMTPLRESERMIAIQRDLAIRMSEASEVRGLLEDVLKAVLEATRLDCGGIYLVEWPGGDLVLRAHRGLSSGFVCSVLRYARNTPQAALVHEGRTSVRNYRRAGYPLNEVVRREGLRALAVVPMVHNGKVLGCINAASRKLDDISPTVLAVMETIAGQVAGFLARLSIAEELRRSERRMRSLLENSSDVIAVTTKEGVIKYVSSSIERVMGHRVEEVVGRSVLDFIHPDDRESCAAGLAELMDRPEETIRQVFRFRDAAGAWRWLEGLVRNLVADKVIEGYVVNTRDITEMERARELLQASEERYRSVFQSTGTAMALIDKDTGICFANGQMMRMLGLGGAEGPDGKTLFLDCVSPEERELFMSQLKTAAGEGHLHLGHFPLEVVDRAGRRIPTLATVAGLPRSEQMVVSLIDITVEKLYEQTLKKHASDLRDFLSIASHELRHPIALIRGYASILREMLEEGVKAADLSEHLPPIIESSERLSRLAEELLEVSRIEQRRLLPDARVQPLVPLIARAVEEIKARTDWSVRLRAADREMLVKVDGDGITRLLVILLENAVDFSPSGSPVEVDLKEAGGKVIIKVMDRGPGISEEHRERVFERFYQVEEVRHHSRPGLGLGLYIAKSIVEGHGGRIWCGPREGGGTVFNVELPSLNGS